MSTEDTAKQRSLAPRAIEEAYSRYSGELRQFFRRLSRRTEISDDLVQEVYLELLRYPPRETLREPQAFLYKIAWHVMHRFYVRERRAGVPMDIETLNSTQDSTAAAQWTDDTLTNLDAEQRILHVLGQLPPVYGAALILWKRDGLPYSEIGRQLGISTHTVRKYLTRAMAHAKKANWDV